MTQRSDDAVLEIRTGLRRMEFIDTSRGERDSGSDRAAVEFVRLEVLAAGQRVRVPLGLRNGQLRELVGAPEHVKSEASAHGSTEHLYRLRGPISIVRAGAAAA
jgi:hypothetical protein